MFKCTWTFELCLSFLRKENLSRGHLKDKNLVENLTAGDAVFNIFVSGDMILK
jgi:hypothetical protein